MSAESTTLPEPTIDEIRAARERITGLVWRTELAPSATLSQMTNTHLKLKTEHLQKTGSFKTRGAFNAVLQLTPEQKARGVVTFSAGNAGQALAYAARRSGVACTVFMASSAVKSKVDAIRG